MPDGTRVTECEVLRLGGARMASGKQAS
jgi:hypothetical protein